jgi:hypothetical protein
VLPTGALVLVVIVAFLGARGNVAQSQEPLQQILDVFDKVLHLGLQVQVLASFRFGLHSGHMQT